MTSDHPPIPTWWSGDQALDAVDFLEQIIADIWQIHGDKMYLAAHSLKPGPASPPPDTSDLPF